MEKYVMVLFLGTGSVIDFRKKELPAGFLAGFAAAGLAVQVGVLLGGDGIESCVSWIAGGAAGILLLGAAKLTNEAIGYGDALTAAVVGIWLGVIPLMEIFFLGLCLAAGYSAWLFLVKKTGGKYRIAFLPFLMAGYLIWLLLDGKGAL